MARERITGDLAIRAVKPGDPRSRLTDGGGLYLRLFVKGGSHGWRLDYSFNGVRKNLSLGTYPDTGLALARKKAAEARRQIQEGIDPSEARKAAKTSAAQQRETQRLVDAGLPLPDSFEAIAREWYDVRREEWSPSYGSKVIARLEADVFPYIGRRPVGTITPADLLKVMRGIEGRGVVETAHRALESCSQVFRYALGKGLVPADPARDLKGLLRKPRVQHFPAITKPERLAELLRASEGYAGTPVVRAALKLAPDAPVAPG